MLETASVQGQHFDGDAGLVALRAALAPLAPLGLAFRYGARTIRPGYHVTEVKAARFATLDCGRNPDSWTETVLQVEDLGPPEETVLMPVGKFLAILAAVDAQVPLDPASRVTIEIGRPGEPMQVFDIGTLTIEGEQAVLTLAPRVAICKPRHRAALVAADLAAADLAPGCAPAAGNACCAPRPAGACCAA